MDDTLRAPAPRLRTYTYFFTRAGKTGKAELPSPVGFTRFCRLLAAHKTKTPLETRISRPDLCPFPTVDRRESGYLS